jgi:hypothetical protein
MKRKIGSCLGWLKHLQARNGARSQRGKFLQCLIEIRANAFSDPAASTYDSYAGHSCAGLTGCRQR